MRSTLCDGRSFEEAQTYAFNGRCLLICGRVTYYRCRPWLQLGNVKEHQGNSVASVIAGREGRLGGGGGKTRYSEAMRAWLVDIPVCLVSDRGFRWYSTGAITDERNKTTYVGLRDFLCVRDIKPLYSMSKVKMEH